MNGTGCAPAPCPVSRQDGRAPRRKGTMTFSAFRFRGGSLGLFLFAACLAQPLAAEWNQWRGSQRSGISDDTTPIAATLPEGKLSPVWESDIIPADRDGGHSSPVVSEGRVYLNLVWHTRVPSTTREIDEEIAGALGHGNTGILGPELTAKLEEARKNQPARLRGDALEEWARKWVKDNFSAEQNLILGSWAIQRFKQGKAAIDVGLLEKINQRVGKPFANIEELLAWAEEEFPPEVRERLLKAVPDTIKVGKDAVVCLDAATGKMLWKFEHDGKPTGRKTSGTCAVVQGRVFAAGSTHLYCVDAKDGKLIWKSQLKNAAGGSSPLVANGKVWLLAGVPVCFSASDGTALWTSKDARGDTASPLLWKTSDGKSTLVFQGNKELIGLDPTSGDKLWAVEGGGQSSPVCEGDHLVIFSAAKNVGLRCYLYQKDGPPKTLWSHWWLSRRYTGSPIIYNEHVYLLCGGKHQCLGLNDGAVKWESDAESTITSPLLVDGRLLIVEQNGLFLRMVHPDPSSYQSLGRAKIEALWCPTPAPWDGRLIVRRKDKLVCFDLRQK